LRICWLDVLDWSDCAILSNLGLRKFISVVGECSRISHSGVDYRKWVPYFLDGMSDIGLRSGVDWWCCVLCYSLGWGYSVRILNDIGLRKLISDVSECSRITCSGIDDRRWDVFRWTLCFLDWSGHGRWNYLGGSAWLSKWRWTNDFLSYCCGLAERGLSYGTWGGDNRRRRRRA
jgi:hypothetical protein